MEIYGVLEKILFGEASAIPIHFRITPLSVYITNYPADDFTSISIYM